LLTTVIKLSAILQTTVMTAALGVSPTDAYIVHTELAPELPWIGNHLKFKLVALHYGTLHYVYNPRSRCASDCKRSRTKYDKTLDILRDEAAWEYGGTIGDPSEFIKKADLYLKLLDD
jgi:hypothetical protein